MQWENIKDDYHNKYMYHEVAAAAVLVVMMIVIIIKITKIRLQQ